MMQKLFSARRRKARGSVLIFSLIILSFLLIAGLSLATLSIVDQKTAISTDRSTLAFQAADSAAELMLRKIYKEGPHSSLDALCEDIDDDGGDNVGPCSCSDGALSGELNNSTYRVNFYDNDLNRLTSCSNTDWRADAVYLKSEGIYGSTTRAIQLVIQAP